MDRLIYNQLTGEIIERIVDCEDSVTLTKLDALEASAELVDAKIQELDAIRATVEKMP